MQSKSEDRQMTIRIATLIRALAFAGALAMCFLLLPISISAQLLTRQSGCKARVKKSVQDPGRQLKLYRWPSAGTFVRDLSLNEEIHLYTDFEDAHGMFYLAYVCPNPGVKCSSKDSDNLNNPIIGFVFKDAVVNGRCFKDHTHRDSGKPVGRGKYYVVAPGVTSIFLRDSDDRNHPMGLLRGTDPTETNCFLRERVVKHGHQFRGWAFSKGVNPRFRYGNIVPVINGRHYLVESPSKCY